MIGRVMDWVEARLEVIRVRWEDEDEESAASKKEKEGPTGRLKAGSSLPPLVHVLSTEPHPLPLHACSLVRRVPIPRSTDPVKPLLLPLCVISTLEHGHSKHHCDSSPQQRGLTFLSPPLLSHPVTYPSRPQTPRPNADLFAVRSALAAFSPPRTVHGAPTKASFKAATSLLASNPAPAPAVIKKPYNVPEWVRRTTTATTTCLCRGTYARKPRMHMSRLRNSRGIRGTIVS
ncbi:hypothetical protein DFH94DRAFT_776964 [Russula ochroleuca]|uniref:Uncharacterized protein n=1 Tax=Russula ochroleuca TaxID=152965 RepID=A0A9P5JXW6_9AGAM|nr:hypothetical protein DFH94DRAFT_776964 [Russula ochroleuca]